MMTSSITTEQVGEPVGCVSQNQAPDVHRNVHIV